MTTNRRLSPQAIAVLVETGVSEPCLVVRRYTDGNLLEATDEIPHWLATHHATWRALKALNGANLLDGTA